MHSILAFLYSLAMAHCCQTIIPNFKTIGIAHYSDKWSKKDQTVTKRSFITFEYAQQSLSEMVRVQGLFPGRPDGMIIFSIFDYLHLPHLNEAK